MKKAFILFLFFSNFSSYSLLEGTSKDHILEFQKAISNGDLEKINHILEQDIDINSMNEKTNATVLEFAIEILFQTSISSYSPPIYSGSLYPYAFFGSVICGSLGLALADHFLKNGPYLGLAAFSSMAGLPALCIVLFEYHIRKNRKLIPRIRKIILAMIEKSDAATLVSCQPLLKQIMNPREHSVVCNSYGYHDFILMIYLDKDHIYFCPAEIYSEYIIPVFDEIEQKIEKRMQLT